MATYDAIVVGLGGMGSAALYHLARRGARVLGLEQFEIPHTRGSSHGRTRIIRLAYWEHPSYVPLLRRAYELWRDLEREAGERLLVITGSIDAAPAGTRPIEGVLDVCARFNLAHECFTGLSLGQRFAGYRLPEDFVAVHQPEGGFLLSERCITAHVRLAQQAGATVHTGERVLRWNVRGTGVEVETTAGVMRGQRLVFTSGAWTGKLLPMFSPVLAPERQVVIWTQPLRPELFTTNNFPVFYVHVPEGSFYGIPVGDVPGFKIGKYHHRRESADPDDPAVPVGAEDTCVLREAITKYFPDADGPVLESSTCLFTNTPDEHFLIGRLPDAPAVSFAAGFSGHGYKFCSVVGEVLADLALTGTTQHDVSLFDPARTSILPGK